MIKWFRDGAPLYIKNVQLPAGKEFKYRYVIVDGAKKDGLRWEKLDK